MGVLDAVLRYKQAEQDRQIADMNVMNNTMDNISQMQKNQMLMDIESKNAAATLATKGLKYDEKGSLVLAPEYETPLDKATRAAKEAETSKDLAKTKLYTAMTGEMGGQAGLEGAPGDSGLGINLSKQERAWQRDNIPDEDRYLYKLTPQYENFEGIPYVIDYKPELTETGKLEFDKRKTQVTREAKGIEESMSGRTATFNDILTNEQELYDLLYQKKPDGSYDFTKFNKDIITDLNLYGGKKYKVGNFTFGAQEPAKIQRLNELLGGLRTGKKLLLTQRGVTEGGMSGAAEMNILKSTNLLNLAFGTDPVALSQELGDSFRSIKEASSIIKTGKTGETTQGTQGVIPKVGDMYNGQKVKSVKRIQ